MTKLIALPLLTAASLTFAAPALADHHGQSPAAAAPLTESYVVEGMVCEGCAQTVTTRLKAVAGVKAVKVNLKARTAIVTYASTQARSSHQKLSQSLNGSFTLKPAPKQAPHH